MDCKYIRQNDIHEKYVMNRLSEAEKSEYEKHIEGCSSCREELNKEREIVEGIQRVGLQEMKNEIQQQVTDVKTRKQKLDWQMILKVAAVIFLIAIIPSAIYYFQTEQGEPISQLVKPKDSKLENESFAYDEALVKDKTETREKTAQPSPKSSVLLKEPVIREQDVSENAPEEDQLTVSSGAVSEKGGRGYGYAGTETEDIKAMTDSDSILEEESEVEQPQIKIIDQQEKDFLSQILSKGIEYQYVGTESEEEKISRFKTQEMTTAQQYDAITSKKLAPETNLMKKGIGSVDSKPTNISNAVYKSNEKRISINFLLADRELEINKESKLPRSFEVRIYKRDSLNWTMNWYVNNEFLEYNPYQMKIVVNKLKLYTIILDAYIYEIDTSVDSTTAILAR